MDYHDAADPPRGGGGDAGLEAARRRQRAERLEREVAVAADPAFVDRTVRAVRAHVASLRRSHHWGSVREALAAAVAGGAARPRELVCYGLGELDDASGGCQLGLLRLLAEEFALGKTAVLAYDPVHTPEERAVRARQRKMWQHQRRDAGTLQSRANLRDPTGHCAILACF